MVKEMLAGWLQNYLPVRHSTHEQLEVQNISSSEIPNVDFVNFNAKKK
jgi:hypothetical protein